jgi:hypothetical protein
VCVKLKKPDVKIDLFLSEFKIGKFFRKFDYFYFDVISIFSVVKVIS